MNTTKKYVLLCENYTDYYLTVVKDTNSIFVATAWLFWLCLKYDRVEMRKRRKGVQTI